MDRLTLPPRVGPNSAESRGGASRGRVTAGERANRTPLGNSYLALKFAGHAVVVGSLSPLVAVLSGALLAAGPPTSTTPELKLPVRSELGRSLGLVLPGRTRTLAAPPTRPFALWGGTYTTAAGESVRITFSSSYPEDPARAQQWVDFLASLAHGSEISTVSIHIAPLAEVQRTCGFGALACYSPSGRGILTPGEDPDDGELSAEAVFAHEYGHHVANSRDNTPWPAVDHGTKRWASSVDICKNTLDGLVFPGAEDRARYRLNPGEGFAEAYRLLNERRLARAESPWQVVSSVFYPSDASLAALEQDVLTPWTRSTVSTVRGSFTRRGVKTRTYALSTLLDGTVTATLRAPRTARLRIDLLSPAGRVGTATVAGSTRLVGTTACGTRSYRVRVTRVKGHGTFGLTLSRP